MTDSLSYHAVHARLTKLRGPARNHPCSVAGCGRQSTAWGWLRTGPARSGFNSHGEAVTWGLDPEDYAALCGRHHSYLDRGGTLTHCPNGHEREAEHAKCRQCEADRQALKWRTNQGFREHRRAYMRDYMRRKRQAD